MNQHHISIQELWIVFANTVFIILASCNFCDGSSHDGYQDTIKGEGKLAVWETGFLDIHHINTGLGDAAFFVFPDGTTMLFDAGDLNSKKFNEKWAPLRASGLHPSDSLTAGQWIAHYIEQVLPKGKALILDYAAISHFHSDHYGNVRKGLSDSKDGAYKLTGITEVAELIPIRTLIDRGAPDYTYPIDMKAYHEKNGGKTFLNYLSFVENRVINNRRVDGLRVGVSNQIKLQYFQDKYPTFKVRNVKSNGTIWTGEGDNTLEYFHKDSVLNENGGFNENPLSLALKISYGAFDYFTGGDMTGLEEEGVPVWFDVETPVAEAVRRVEVTTLNHHGNRDATNNNFVKLLDPRVVVQQSWCSDHPGQEVYHRLNTKRFDGQSRDVFATNIHEETKVTLGPWFTKGYQSMEGHILIRVLPGGDQYYVFILDDSEVFPMIKKKFGPYKSE